MKKAFNILIYVSLLFLVFFLYKMDYFRFGAITFEPFYLTASIILLFAGFLLQSLCWWKALRVHGCERTIRTSIVSHGQAIFAKYIPGKVWVILGRAGYLAEQRPEFKTLSFISLKEQLIYIWTGMVISAVPVFVFYGFRWMSVLVVLICLLLSLVLYSKRINRKLFALAEKVFRRKMDFPVIDFRKSLPVILYELVFWITISAAFLLFTASATTEASLSMAFAYPLGICLGILAIILPGGLGMREGVLTGFLVLAGMNLATATTIAILSRIWYILGETFLFAAASFMRMKSKRHS